MVALLGLHTHEILYEKTGKIIAEIWSAREKAKCYEEVANHSQRFFTFIKKKNNFRVFLILMIYHTDQSKVPFFK